MRKTEVAGVAKLLLEDYESPEEAARTIINWLDADRGKRTSYVAVMQFSEVRPFYVGLGPYPGYKSATNAAIEHPAAGEAYKMAVVPMTSKEGVDAILKELDSYRKPA